MEIDLLIEVQVFLGPLTLARETGVINSAAIAIPGRAPTGGRILDMRNCVTQFFSIGRIIEVEGAVFAPALRE